MSSKKLRKHSEDFKRKAVARLSNGERVLVVAQDLKLAKSQLYAWRKAMVEQRKEPKRVEPSGSNNGGGGMKEAIIYLRHAADAITKDIATGRLKKLPKSSLYSLLALQALSGE